MVIVVFVFLKTAITDTTTQKIKIEAGNKIKETLNKSH